MENKPTLYLETTIPSYLAARPSRDLIIAANQQATHEWWNEERKNFKIYISQAVLIEAKAGDPEVAFQRVKHLEGLEILPATEEVEKMAKEYLAVLGIPKKSALDAVHIAYAVVYKLDYLLTWNCKHLAHGEIRRKLRRYNGSIGLETPEIVTPIELMRRD
ncbi:putative nucleic acid-binding protein [Desulfofundulus luciae]|uniref:Nucleic acid-binding protein n=2 Tax=Desulfofundulus TaxID=2282741 RepID=A0ABU0B0S8_9FIRM|nr:type II toxin-antitoxin system VapC family toxin [Desulfofundulus luciae]MDQ0285892.1 putative nucleic acid-binding protein [Desulfofundulus luciae]